MAWFSGRVNLGNLSDLAGAVKNISDSVSEGVKNIEKNFDSALGLEEKSNAAASSSNEASGLWSTDRKALFDPVMSFMGQKDGESADEPQLRVEESKASSSGEEEAVEQEGSDIAEEITHLEEVAEKTSDAIVPPVPVVAEEEKNSSEEKNDHPLAASSEISNDLSPIPAEQSETNAEHIEGKDSFRHIQEEPLNKSLEEHPKDLSVEPSDLGLEQPESTYSAVQVSAAAPVLQGLDIGSLESNEDQKTLDREVSEEVLPVQDQVSSTDSFTEREEPSVSGSFKSEETEKTEESSQINLLVTHHAEESAEIVSEPESVENDARSKTVEMTGNTEDEINVKPESSNPVSSSLTTADPVAELEKVTKEMKIMESALQGAARQAQAKADEIARMMNENEQLKAVIDDLRRKSNDAEIESIREEYHQRVSVLERKVYALTRERDTLRRESNKKSDAAALLKEKDEIITQVMAEGEQLSKKQAAQESTIRKLRAQIRELEEEKKGLATKLEVEESKVESIKKDKAATEKLLQETIERHQTELTTQKDYYTNALNAAKEAESLAEARANSEARTELESRIREAEEREAMLVQALEELRQTLTRKEQQAVSREDMLQREIEDLQKRYQASERRCEELITQVPESTRPLLRQIEAIQETTARKAEAWAAVERSLNLRLQEAEGKAAGAEERERSINERLSQTLSRINVLEAQISCLRAEQTQLTRSLEKERQRAAENRQEYLALKEEADTNEGRAKQLEEEIKDMRKRHKQEIQEAITKQELLQQELEKEKAARLDQEKVARLQVSTVSDQSPLKKKNLALDNGILSRKPSSASSLSSMEESYFLQASLDSSDDFLDRRNAGEGAVSPYMKSTALRQKEGEIASYMSRLASLESIRDSLAEELVKLTAQCEKLKAESALLPGVRAELDALRRRHSAALELMGERDEELEELRNDIVDLKEMYREQVNLLVNKIQTLNSTGGTRG